MIPYKIWVVHPKSYYGVIKFVAKRNNITQRDHEQLPELIDRLEQHNLLTAEAAQASKGIYKSHRDDMHHMNEKISVITDWHGFAMRNLAKVEFCVFGADIVNGALRLHYPQHWDYVDGKFVKTWSRFN